MAIDTTLFMADVPAGTYAVGDVIPLKVKAGPSVVRDGYGRAVLKEIVSGGMYGAVGPAVGFTVQNSNWVDSLQNNISYMNDATAIVDGSTGVQSGNDCELQPNSSWTVYATVLKAQTTTAANTIFVTIDVDYPNVASVQDPSAETGYPVTTNESYDVNLYAFGTSDTATWNVYNVDNLKAGYRYLLQKISIMPEKSSLAVGFVAMSNAAGMQGLTRIIPVASLAASIMKHITYASPLTKGPMDIKFLLFAASASTDTTALFVDYVKRNNQ